MAGKFMADQTEQIRAATKSGTMTKETNIMHILTDQPHEMKVNDQIHKHGGKAIKITISEKCFPAEAAHNYPQILARLLLAR